MNLPATIKSHASSQKHEHASRLFHPLTSIAHLQLAVYALRV
jgi:hypothetical protein